MVEILVDDVTRDETESDLFPKANLEECVLD